MIWIRLPKHLHATITYDLAQGQKSAGLRDQSPSRSWFDEENSFQHHQISRRHGSSPQVPGTVPPEPIFFLRAINDNRFFFQGPGWLERKWIHFIVDTYQWNDPDGKDLTYWHIRITAFVSIPIAMIIRKTGPVSLKGHPPVWCLQWELNDQKPCQISISMFFVYSTGNGLSLFSNGWYVPLMF